MLCRVFNRKVAFRSAKGHVLSRSERRHVPAKGRDLVDSARKLQLRLAMSVFVSGLFTSAFVVAQVPKTETLPTASTNKKTFQEKVAKTSDKKESGGQDVKIEAPTVWRAVRAKARTKKEVEDALAANRQRAIQRYVTMGSPFVRAELIFVRHVCPMSQEQLRQISRGADRVLWDIVTKIADARLQGRIQQGTEAAANPDSARLLQDGLRAVMKEHLSPEQWTIYQAELDKRLASRKPIAVRYLVEALDRDLYLSDQQRATLAALVSAHWDDGWDIYLGYMLQGNQFYPMTIDPFVLPVLSDVQKRVWQGFQKAHLSGIFGGNFGGFANDHDDLSEELGEARKAEPRNAHFDRQLMMEQSIFELNEVVRAAQVQQRLEIRKAEIKKIESKKAETKKGVAN